MEDQLETLVEKARNGDSHALENLIGKIQDRIYGLAMRMLWHPEDAEDATQEILVKIVTHLGDFRRESAFTTWCYRIAGNHLLTTRKRRAELPDLTFDRFEEEIDRGIAYVPTGSSHEPEQDLLAREVMIGCIQGVMLCLDRPLRLTYLLAEVYGVDSQRGGEVLDITPQSFRKRLSRARGQIKTFLVKNCGLLNTANPCTCSRQGPYAMKTGLVNPKKLLFATHPCGSRREEATVEQPRDADEWQRVALLLSEPEYAAPHAFVKKIRAMIDSGNIRFAHPTQ